MSKVLEAKGIRKSFKTTNGMISVLQGVGLSLEQGCSLSIQGQSGSGKSTLLNIISGLESADEGEVLWDGVSLQSLSKSQAALHRGSLLGFVFQSYYLTPELNSIENVLMPARILKNFNSETKGRAEELLVRVGLKDRLKHNPLHLSGGERQRVALARALINRPKLLLADEPTGNLDEETGEVVMDLLMNLTKEEKAALVLVTHNPIFGGRTDTQMYLKRGVFVDSQSKDS